MPPSPATAEPFSLDLHGGAVFGLYAQERPDVDTWPWGDLPAPPQAEALALCRWWTDMALQEYAAAAAQAEVARLALRAGAPLDLTALVSLFPFDELVHTELCVRVANGCGGAVDLRFDREAVLGRLRATTDAPAADLAHAAMAQLCVAEGVTSEHVRARHAAAGAPLLREIWGRMARDEARHARGGWLLLEWASAHLDDEERAAVTATGRRALDMARGAASAVAALSEDVFSTWSVFGSGGHPSYAAEARAAQRAVAARLDRWARGDLDQGDV